MLSVQSKFFALSYSVLVVGQALCELYLSKLVPKDKSNLKIRFWSRAVVDVTVSVLVGIVGYTIISVLSKIGWKKLSWGLAVIPGIFLVSGALILQGTNTVLDKSAGVGCYGLVIAAVQQNKK
jgi:hypothetical protein